MKCTCSIRKLPCVIHGEKGLPQPEVREIKMFAIRLHDRWVGDKWVYFTTISVDAIRVFQSSDFLDKTGAIIAASEKLREMS